MGNWTSVASDGSTMKIYFNKPEGERALPAVLVMFHRTGMDQFTRDQVDALASKGFLAAAPDFYHRHADLVGDAPADFRNDNEFISDIEASLDHFRGRGDVDMKRVGILGHCMGGRTSFFGASVFPDQFKLCVVNYGGGMFSAWGEGPTAFERLDNLTCPVLGHFGGLDKNPSLADVQKFDEKLRQNGVEHTFYEYADANHAFQDPNNKKGNFHPEATKLAWSRTIKFLHEGL